MVKRKSITLIVKPTHDCNLRCEYCYVDKNAEKGEMTYETLESMIKKSAKYVGKDGGVYFIWHGGEPFLRGIEFFEKIVKLENKYRSSCPDITNGVQSNATLVNDEILDFCEKNEFNIGTSLDGPREINNKTRHYASGKGAFDDILNGIKNIGSRKKIGGGAIAILSKHNLDKIDEMYDFFKENNINIKINPLIKSGRANEKYNELALESGEYGKAMIKLFDRWFYEKEKTISIDPLETIIGNLITGVPFGCNFSKSCQEHFLSVGPQGDVYPCGRFDGIKEFWLGNIAKGDLYTMINSPKRKKLLERNAETIEGCASCEYKQICNSGCVHNAYMVKGDIFDKDYYCPSYKALFKHIKESVVKELKKAEVVNFKKTQ